MDRIIGRGEYRVFSGRQQTELGRANEARAWVVFQRLMGSMEKPEWLKSIRKATWKEDHEQETDFVVETTDIGPIFLNIKSSMYHVDLFNSERRSRRVIAILINAELAAEEYLIEDIILDILWKEYEHIRVLRGDSI